MLVIHCDCLYDCLSTLRKLSDGNAESQQGLAFDVHLRDRDVNRRYTGMDSCSVRLIWAAVCSVPEPPTSKETVTSLIFESSSEM